MSIWLGNQRLDSGIAHNIGDIFYTTRNDTSLNGAVECNGGTYSTADYTGAGSIGELLAGGKLPYVSLAEYATLLSTNGVVGVFGWDGTGTTTFRVPTIKDVFIEAGQASQSGNYIPAGLPNLSGYTELWGAGFRNGSGVFSVTSGGTNNQVSQGGANSNNLNFNASGSNPIYGNSDTVQPKAVKYRAMVQLFNSTTDEAVATVGMIVAQVGELNSHRVVDFQIPTADNGYTWYREYADGWIEQGGRTMTSSQTITFPIPFTDVPNMTWGFCTQRTLASYDGEICFGNITATNFISGFRITDAISPGFMWRAEGIAA